MYNFGRKIIVIRKNKTVSIHDYIKEEKNKNIYLSVVIPAYNEEKRLPIMLKETLNVNLNKTR